MAVAKEVHVQTKRFLWKCRGFSKDQLKGKQLMPMFRPDALVIFRAKVKATRGLEDALALKTTRASGQNIGKSCFHLSWALENPLFTSFWRIMVFIRKTFLVWYIHVDGRLL